VASKRHRCNDPTCAGYDLEKLYKRIKKHGFQVVGGFKDDPKIAYTVGLFANHGTPELMMFGADDHNEDEFAMFCIELSVIGVELRDRVAIAPGTSVDVTPDVWVRSLQKLGLPDLCDPCRHAHMVRTVYLWPAEDVHRPYPPRQGMGIARSYYRDVWMKRLDDVPVSVVSHQPYTSTADALSDSAFVCEHVLAGARIEFIGRGDEELRGAWFYYCDLPVGEHESTPQRVHRVHYTDADPTIGTVDLDLGESASRVDGEWIVHRARRIGERVDRPFGLGVRARA